MLKSKTTIVIEALQAGLPVTLNGTIYRLFKQGDIVPTRNQQQGEVIAPYFLGTPATPNNQQYFGLPLSFTQFLVACDNLSDEEAQSIATDITLNETRRPRKS